jgi:Fe-S cluster biogenesis protein NfuA
MENQVLQPNDVRIRAEPLQTDPDTCRFTVSHSVLDGRTAFFGSREEAVGSPLVERLFELDGVRSVLVYDDVVTVGKEPSVEWPALMKPIGGLIRAQLVSGEPGVVVKEEDLGEAGKRSDSQIRAAVQRVLDEGINPFVSQHGGAISVVDVKDRVVSVRMSGGCQGCSSASVTLRQGVERMLLEEVPDIERIVDVTSHDEGETPYYS